MATTSCTPHPWKYDVFVSFRGEDIRKSFVEHLFNDFNQKGIYAFRDDNELPRGEEVSPQLYKAIEESRFLIVIFSKNYAFSVCCFPFSIWSLGIIVLVLVMILVDLLGVMAILNVQLNAVSVVNLLMTVGISVKFCVHIRHAFLVSSGDRDQRTKEALGTIGASVFSGITITNLVEVIVLRFSRTEIFVVYYFQMYPALVLLGFLHGLIFLPVGLLQYVMKANGGTKHVWPPSIKILVERKDDNKSSDSPSL